MRHLIELLDGFGTPRVALVGDFMLDRYIFGDTDRISPEAPVPVLRVVGSEGRPGGAASVAAHVLSLGGRPICIGIIGQDEAGEELLGHLTGMNAETSTLTRLPGRVTTLKQRLIGLAQHRHRQQMLRLDEEMTDPLPRNAHATLRASLRSALTDCQVVALEDYNKGLFDEVETPQLIADAASAGRPVVVDPAPIGDYRRYRGATVLTPNRYEAELASGVRVTDEATAAQAAGRLLLAAEAQAVVITLDREGAYLATRDGQGRRIPTRERSVYDVTGAGDAVLAMFSLALAEGCGFEDAVALANVAGGLEVERFGIVPVGREEVLDELRKMVGLRGAKVMTRPGLSEEVSRRRARGDRIVFTNGCFDLLHMGHVRYLQQARELGSCLIVAINSDDSVRRLKGASRPVIGQAERADMLGALECVDYVTVFDEDTPIPLLELLRPEVLVKGGSTGEIVGADVVEGYGGQVVKVDLVEGLSTTDIIDRILRNHDQSG
jgi:D-beta-D-heptose 7-phosphate kinase/D-beta-D-heptose 1-phosphate adenosyltransferase